MRVSLHLLFSLLTISLSAQNWTQQTSNTSSNLAAIHFYSNTNGVAIGSGGTVVSTTDGGETWTSASTGADFDVLCADFTGDKIYAAGEMVSSGDGFVIKSDDKGQNWSTLITGLSERILGISFSDDSHGWIGGRKGLLQKTSDGGQNWTDGNSPTGDDILEVFFLDEQTGWISAEDGLIFFTQDGGNTWTQHSTGIQRDFYTIDFISATQGFTAGKGGNLLVFSAGGNNWISQNSNTQEDITDLQMLTGTNIWAAATGGIILNTTDGGSTWNSGGEPAFGELTGISMLNDTLGWVCGAGGVIAKFEGESGGGGNDLQASFSTDNEACLDQELTFTDNSQGDAVGWEWDYGDGSAVATTQNATHTYNQTGQYMVTLTIEDAQGNTDQSQQIVQIYGVVTADFSMALDTIDLSKGNTVILTNQSSNASSYNWDYGNGQGSQAENPIATYSIPGTYTIQLTAMNPGCEDQAEKTIVVINPTGLNAISEIDIDVFPNPATDHIQINSGEMVTGIRIINLLGTTVYEDMASFSNQHPISLNNFATGTYFLIMETRLGTITKKILIR